jgi:nucleotide-binding universal stress UspA family protein
MKKILVPTDFSDTSKNAAAYAVQLASNIPGSTVILYHVFDILTPGSDGSILTETVEDKLKVLNLAFANFEDELKQVASVPIQSLAEQGSKLIDGVKKYVHANGIDFVVMGITGGSKIDRVLMGSNAVDMARAGICPVIIVPPNATFKKIENVLLATDFKEVQKSVPVAAIKSVLNLFNPILHIVHAGEDKSIEEKKGFPEEKAWLEQAFTEYDPDFYFIRSNDFLEAISNFTADHYIDIIVTVPKDHSFLSSFYKASHTKKLAYHSHIPILAIHE